MDDKANEKEEFLETLGNEETDDIKFGFLKKVSLGIAPSMISGIADSYNKSTFDIDTIRSTMIQAADLDLKPSLLAGIADSYTKPTFDIDTIRSTMIQVANLDLKPSLLAGIADSYTKPTFDIDTIRSTLIQAADLGFKPSLLAGIADSYIKPTFDIDTIRSTLIQAADLGLKPSLFDGIINTYQNTFLSSELIKGKFISSESLKVVGEFANEIQSEIETLEEIDPSSYSEEQTQFVLKSLEEWIEGSISFKNTLERMKGNKLGIALLLVMQTVFVNLFFNTLHILEIFNDQQLQQDREVMENVRAYIETEVGPYKYYKKYFTASEEWVTSYSIGWTRKEVQLREGRSKTAPTITNGFVGQKTLVLMLDRKSNWRKVEVKINETYLQGWVPESTIIRLKKNK